MVDFKIRTCERCHAPLSTKVEYMVPTRVTVKCAVCGWQTDLTLEEYFTHQEMRGRIEWYDKGKITCIYRLEDDS